MALFQPKFTDGKTGKRVTSRVWWYEFSFAGRRVRESTKTHLLTLAREAEQNRRRELERAFVGAPIQKRASRVNSVADMVKSYLIGYELDHRDRPQSILFAKGRLAHVKRLLGTSLLRDLTEDVIRGYIKTRIEEKASGRTINMVGDLSRAIGKPWSFLWPKVRKQEERKDVGEALSPEAEKRLLDAVGSKKRWEHAAVIVRALLLTGMRSGELTGATWGQVDFERRVLTVGRAKTSAGTGRQIPMNNDQSRAMMERYSHIRMAAKREAVESLGFTKEPPKPETNGKESPKVARTGRIQ
jgi:integrase